MIKRILMVDLDGTIIKNDKGVVSKNVASVLLPLAKKGQLIINSARHPQGVQNAIEKFLPFVPTIALNGAALYKQNWHSPEKKCVFDPQLVDFVIDKSKEQDISLSIYTEDDWWVTRFDSKVEYESTVTGMSPKYFIDILPHKVLKMTAIGSVKNIIKFRSELSNDIDVNLAQSNLGYCEISPAGITKATFVPTMLDLLNIDRNNCLLYFIGDSFNDIECALYADRSYTFLSAPNNLKKIANKIFKVEVEYELIDMIHEILNKFEN